MKGIILAGGLGKRLLPLTKITNKHLLPIYNKPMIYYPLQTLVDAGIRDILVVTGGNHAGEFLRLLGNGSEFGLTNLGYAYQESEGGIAHALRLAENFVKTDSVTVILGDNIITDDIKNVVKNFQSGAHIFLKEVDNPQRFGVAEIQGNRVVSIEEKPTNPKSNLAVTGVYIYDNGVFDIIKTLRPSNRGELEITDVNNEYIRRQRLSYTKLTGEWTDAGTFESLMKANLLMWRRAGGVDK